MKRPATRGFLIALLWLHGLAIPPPSVAANPVGDGTFSADEALKLCLPSPQRVEISPNAYGIDGHQWLALRIAMAATHDYRLSHGIAYYAQYPDIDTSYEAIGRSLNIIDLGWRKSIMDDLHSLHGGNAQAIQRRRSRLSEGVTYWYNSEDRQLWQVGLMVHALGDSYAHTKGKLNSPTEKAYGIPLGHAADSLFSRDPDTIKNQKPKAIEYANKLYFALTGTSDNTTSEFDAIIYEINNCNDDSCDFMRGFYRAQKGEKSVEQMGVFTDCMNRNAKKLTKDQVLLITNWIAE